MKIHLTLKEMSDRCNDWVQYCEDTGVSYYALNEGFGHTDVTLTLEEAIKYGIVGDNS